MARKIQGILKNNGKQRSVESGYRPVWDMGRAGRIKKRQRITGIDRPST
jgi:hypothetical protein